MRKKIEWKVSPHYGKPPLLLSQVAQWSYCIARHLPLTFSLQRSQEYIGSFHILFLQNFIVWLEDIVFIDSLLMQWNILKNHFTWVRHIWERNSQNYLCTFDFNKYRQKSSLHRLYQLILDQQLWEYLFPLSLLHGRVNLHFCYY